MVRWFALPATISLWNGRVVASRRITNCRNGHKRLIILKWKYIHLMMPTVRSETKAYLLQPDSLKSPFGLFVWPSQRFTGQCTFDLDAITIAVLVFPVAVPLAWWLLPLLPRSPPAPLLPSHPTCFPADLSALGTSPSFCVLSFFVYVCVYPLNYPTHLIKELILVLSFILGSFVFSANVCFCE